MAQPAKTTDDYNDLIGEIKAHLSEHLEEQVTTMLTSADEKLFDMSEAATNNEEQSRCFELMKQLRNMRSILSKNFVKKVAEYLKPFKESDPDNKDSLDNLEELSLVGQEEMEDMVLIKSMGTQATSTYREKLSHLEKRFEDLALKAPNAFEKNALDPVNFCQAFNDSLGIIFDLHAKKILFKFFETYTLKSLGTMYDDINLMMIDAGVLPEIPTHGDAPVRSKRLAQKPSAAEAPLNQQESDDVSHGEAQEPQSHGGYAMTAAPGMSPYKDTSSFSGGDTADAGASIGAGAGGHPSSYQHQTAGMQASHVDNVLSNYFGSPVVSGTPSSADESSVAAQTTGNNQYLAHTEILSALSNIQQQEEFADPKELKFDSKAIKQAVISSIAKQSGGVVTKRINHIAEKTIDFIEMIFDAIIDDDSISDTIKTLLLRLQIPVIKASMLDQEFFIYDNHPARVFLDKITEIGIGITDRDNEIYSTLNKIINNLISEYDLHTSTFQNSLDELNKFIGRRERIAREKEEEEQQKVLKEHARSTVLKTLRSVTKNKKLPESVHALILRRWPTLLFSHYVDFGKENDAWVHTVEILRDIIESIQPPEDAEALARMKANRGELTNLAREYLSRTKQSKKDLDAVISDLEATYDVIEERADFAEEQVESAVEAISNEAPQEKVSLPEVEEKPKQTLPPNIMPGMWFKVHTSDDTRPRRCKLSVIIVEDSNLVFVSYAGEVIIEKGFDEFSEELDLYKSKIIMGHSVFDHALQKVITDIHPN